MSDANTRAKDVPPPRGYESWLDYAVETLDLRKVELDYMFEDGPTPKREEMRLAAQKELQELRATAILRRDNDST